LIKLRQIETCYYELRLADQTGESDDISPLLKESREKFDAALNDDFNTSLGLSVFFNMIKTINSLAADEKITKTIANKTLPILEYMLEVLGIKIQTVSDDEIKTVFELINKREALRGEKQFEDADKIRERISNMGISLIDHKNKTLWMKKEMIKAEK
jgi:cysteinyl-tRNA synthetase